jgi:hypothetical protein
MRNLPAISLAALIATGCAARAQETTAPRHFDCGGTSVVATGATLSVQERDGSKMTIERYLRDDHGDHFARPTGDGFVVPRDRREDAMRLSSGQRDVCIAEAGYTDALQRFMRGADHHTIAQELSLDDEDAKVLIRRALQRLQTRYYRDR